MSQENSCIVNTEGGTCEVLSYLVAIRSDVFQRWHLWKLPVESALQASYNICRKAICKDHELQVANYIYELHLLAILMVTICRYQEPLALIPN